MDTAMINKKVILAVLLLSCGLSVSAQKRGGKSASKPKTEKAAETKETKAGDLNREMEVTRAYEPTVSEANKLNVKPNLNQTHISRTHQTDIFFGHHAQSSCCSIFSRFFIHKRIVEINSQTGRCSRHRCSQRFCQQIIVMCVVIQTQIQFCISRLSFFQHVKSFIELGRHR